MDDVPWNQMTDHIRNKLVPFLRLLKDIDLLQKGEVEITDEQGEVIKYKGCMHRGKAFGEGVATRVESYTVSASLGMEVQL